VAEKVLAAVRTGPSKTEIRDYPMPDIPEDAALMKMEVGGICGTDVKLYKHPPSNKPTIMGHENIGYIAKAGREFTQRKGFKEGDLVFVEHYVSCGKCEWCHAGQYRHCENTNWRTNPDAIRYGYTSDEKPPHLWGGFAQYMYLPWNSVIHHVPKGVTPELAGLVTPMWSNVTISDGYEHKRFAPPSLANMYVPPGYIEDVPGETSKAFAAKIRAMFPDTVYVNEHAAFGYVAVKAMAEAWKKAGTTDTDAVIKALEGDISVPDAPGGPWTLRGSQHHAAMPTYLFKVDDKHKLTLITELGINEPTFLTDIGVDMTKKSPGRQFLPPDNQKWKSFFPAN